eukprot:gene1707-1059_t
METKMRGVVPFATSLRPEAQRLASSLPLAPQVDVPLLGVALQHTINWICLGHALLDVIDEESAHRRNTLREEQATWDLLQSVMAEHRDILSREMLEQGRRRELAAAAIRKFYGKVLEGEALFRSMLEKRKQIAETKYGDGTSSSSDTDPVDRISLCRAAGCCDPKGCQDRQARNDPLHYNGATHSTFPLSGRFLPGGVRLKLDAVRRILQPAEAKNVGTTAKEVRRGRAVRSPFLPFNEEKLGRHPTLCCSPFNRGANGRLDRRSCEEATAIPLRHGWVLEVVPRLMHHLKVLHGLLYTDISVLPLEMSCPPFSVSSISPYSLSPLRQANPLFFYPLPRYQKPATSYLDLELTFHVPPRNREPPSPRHRCSPDRSLDDSRWNDITASSHSSTLVTAERKRQAPVSTRPRTRASHAPPPLRQPHLSASETSTSTMTRAAAQHIKNAYPLLSPGPNSDDDVTPNSPLPKLPQVSHRPTALRPANVHHLPWQHDTYTVHYATSAPFPSQQPPTSHSHIRSDAGHTNKQTTKNLIHSLNLPASAHGPVPAEQPQRGAIDASTGTASGRADVAPAPPAAPAAPADSLHAARGAVPEPASAHGPVPAEQPQRGAIDASTASASGRADVAPAPPAAPAAPADSCTLRAVPSPPQRTGPCLRSRSAAPLTPPPTARCAPCPSPPQRTGPCLRSPQRGAIDASTGSASGRADPAPPAAPAAPVDSCTLRGAVPEPASAHGPVPAEQPQRGAIDASTGTASGRADVAPAPPAAPAAPADSCTLRAQPQRGAIDASTGSASGRADVAPAPPAAPAAPVDSLHAARGAVPEPASAHGPVPAEQPQRGAIDASTGTASGRADVAPAPPAAPAAPVDCTLRGAVPEPASAHGPVPAEQPQRGAIDASTGSASGRADVAPAPPAAPAAPVDSLHAARGAVPEPASAHGPVPAEQPQRGAIDASTASASGRADVAPAPPAAPAAPVDCTLRAQPQRGAIDASTASASGRADVAPAPPAAPAAPVDSCARCRARARLRARARACGQPQRGAIDASTASASGRADVAPAPPAAPAAPVDSLHAARGAVPEPASAHGPVPAEQPQRGAIDASTASASGRADVAPAPPAAPAAPADSCTLRAQPQRGAIDASTGSASGRADVAPAPPAAPAAPADSCTLRAQPQRGAIDASTDSASGRADVAPAPPAAPAAPADSCTLRGAVPEPASAHGPVPAEQPQRGAIDASTDSASGRADVAPAPPAAPAAPADSLHAARGAVPEPASAHGPVPAEQPQRGAIDASTASASGRADVAPAPPAAPAAPADSCTLRAVPPGATSSSGRAGRLLHAARGAVPEPASAHGPVPAEQPQRGAIDASTDSASGRADVAPAPPAAPAAPADSCTLRAQPQRGAIDASTGSASGRADVAPAPPAAPAAPADSCTLRAQPQRGAIDASTDSASGRADVAPAPPAAPAAPADSCTLRAVPCPSPPQRTGPCLRSSRSAAPLTPPPLPRRHQELRPRRQTPCTLRAVPCPSPPQRTGPVEQPQRGAIDASTGSASGRADVAPAPPAAPAAPADSLHAARGAVPEPASAHGPVPAEQPQRGAIDASTASASGRADVAPAPPGAPSDGPGGMGAIDLLYTFGVEDGEGVVVRVESIDEGASGSLSSQPSEFGGSCERGRFGLPSAVGDVRGPLLPLFDGVAEEAVEGSLRSFSSRATCATECERETTLVAYHCLKWAVRRHLMFEYFTPLLRLIRWLIKSIRTVVIYHFIVFRMVVACILLLSAVFMIRGYDGRSLSAVPWLRHMGSLRGRILLND